MNRPSRLTIGNASLLVLLSCGFANQSCAQGSKADYERADALERKVRNKVAGASIDPVWSDDGHRLWYRQPHADGGTELIVVNTKTARKQRAYNHEAVARALAREWKKPVDAKHLPIERAHVGKNEIISLLLVDSDANSAVIARIDGSRITVEHEIATGPFALPEEPPSPDLRSWGGSKSTSVLFINSTTEPVRIFWVDSGGGRRLYATVEPGNIHRQHTYSGHAWVVVDKTGNDRSAFRARDQVCAARITGSPGPRVQPEATQDLASRGQSSPNDRWTVIFRDHDAFLRHRLTRRERRLTDDGTPDDSYGPPISWSPGGRSVVVTRTRKGDNPRVQYIESSPSDQLQPKLVSFEYLKPGDRIPIQKPCLFHVGRRKRIPIDDALFHNPWSLSHFHWKRDGSRFFFVYNQRGHQVLRLIGVDADNGEAKAVAEEKSETFVDYPHKTFVHHLEQTDEIVWMSERDGWNHLYLIDRRSGEVKRQITSGSWVIRDVDRVDEEKREVWFRAGGIVRNQDPYYLHLARANLDRTQLTVLTEGDGTHTTHFSPDRKLFVDTWSRVDQPAVHELRHSRDGSLVCELVRADWTPLLETGWNPPIPFTAKGRDGKTDIFGVIYRPTTFDSDRTYPVIEAIYAGPHGQHVPKAFRTFHGPQSLAELGFITVQIDGMGTNWRSKRFHDVCWKNLADAGFPDRIRWIKAAAKEIPAMDIEHVGIYGGSAGGQNAMRALIDHHDFYEIAVADCGCHDNRMDKIWWNELWMGYPVDESYAKSSNVVCAPRFEGKLLLTVGELDRNVDPASTMQVVDALIRADKDFELIVFPGGGHGAGGSPYGIRRRRDFFVRHLFGREPRWETP